MGSFVQQLTAPQNLFRYQSGRVIALGRVMLGTMFLLAVWLDRTEPVQAVTETYVLLIAYALFAILTMILTWRNWWLDARLAVITHGFDMAVFTAIVFSTNGSTSPFFLFFVLPLLAAAIRWSWRETALTAAALVALYFAAGLLVSRSQTFELERFVVRSGHLMILSLLLIWFGVHQRFGRLSTPVEDFDLVAGAHQNPFVGSLRLAIESVGAGSGALFVGRVGEEPSDGCSIVDGEQRSFTAEQPLVGAANFSALLCDIRRDRALTRPQAGQFRFGAASAVLNMDEIRRLGLTQGMVAEVRTGTYQGWLVLWDVPDLSTDFLDYGRELARTVGALLDRYALLDAIEAGAAVRTRLSLARDVHDSIVQFLAGAAFRIEAIKRSAGSGAAVETDLDELKRLFVEEQGEIRGFVMALRQHRDLELAEAVAELRVLADRLASQWSVDCRVSAEGDEVPIPIRLQLDLQQLLREAVANAVRHGGADRIDVGLSVGGGEVRLSVADNGTGFASGDGVTAEPWSLKERVERAHGSLRLDSAPGSTNLLISLPLRGVAA
jgi:signal transduction histidine kinase